MAEKFSHDLLVAFYIRDHQPCWFDKIVEGMPKLSKHQISRCLDTLFDWSIVFGEYGEIMPGVGGRLLLIDRDALVVLNNLNPPKPVEFVAEIEFDEKLVPHTLGCFTWSG